MKNNPRGKVLPPLPRKPPPPAPKVQPPPALTKAQQLVTALKT